MGRPKKQPGQDSEGPPLGPLIAKSLMELGYREPPTVQLSRIAREVTAKRPDRPLSKQRLKAILKAERVNPDTLQWLADGLGLTVAELISGKRKNPKKTIDE